MRSSRISTAMMLTALFAGCDYDSPPSPSRGSTVTFAVANETFRVWLTSDEQLTAARAAQAGGSANIPIGRIAAGTQVNSGWSWHLQELSFVEATVEICDGRPSDVERQKTGFGDGRYCPWTARILAIEPVTR